MDKYTLVELKKIAKDNDVKIDFRVSKEGLYKFLQRYKMIPKEKTSPELSIESYSPVESPKHKNIKGHHSVFMTYINNKHKNVCVPYMTSGKCKSFMTTLMWYFESEYLTITCVKDNFKHIALDDKTVSHELHTHLYNCDERFFVMHILLDSRESKHSNILIVDTEKMSFEVYDPHGVKRYSGFKHEKLEKRLAKILKEYKHITVEELCPLYSFQAIENLQKKGEYREKIIKKYGKEEGFCTAWAFFYIDLRLKYPNFRQKTLQEKAIEKLQKGDMEKFIVGYSNFVSKQFPEYYSTLFE